MYSMKALVLCGGIPQIELLQNLKNRGITTILADMNEKVSARQYADVFYPVSVLDTEKVKEVAQIEQVDFVISVCADQVLQVAADVSEALGLPCYIDAVTAERVSKKSLMKKSFVEHGVPTSKFLIAARWQDVLLDGFAFPLIVKPIDSYSSRGVRKVCCLEDLHPAFEEAVRISRSNTAIIEEFVEGPELTVDVYVEDSTAHILCVSQLSKIGEDGKFVIHRTTNPAKISTAVMQEIQDAAQKIAEAFSLKNSPMLIQLIQKDDAISVVEFCARTGGGDKFRLIKKVSGFDVVDAVVELTLGNLPHYEPTMGQTKRIVNEFLYCQPGVLDRMEGLDELLRDGVISEYFILKSPGHTFNTITSSGDRVAYYTIEADDEAELAAKRLAANRLVKAWDVNGVDLLRHDLIVKAD